MSIQQRAGLSSTCRALSHGGSVFICGQLLLQYGTPALTFPTPVLFLSFESSSAGPRTLPSGVSRALAALRCLPCLVGSFATTEGDRREGVQRPLRLIEDLLAACSRPEGGVTECSSTMLNGRADTPTDSSAIKRGRKRGKGKSKVEGTKNCRVGRGVGEQTDEGYRGAMDAEVAVVQAYALEAGVGLCCLVPAGERGDSGHEETLERLIRWHDRWVLMIVAKWRCQCMQTNCHRAGSPCPLRRVQLVGSFSVVGALRVFQGC